MCLLFDMYIFLWIVINDLRFSMCVCRLILVVDECFVSSVSIWEVVIKVGFGKFDIDVGELICVISVSGICELLVCVVYGVVVCDLFYYYCDFFD